MQPNFEEEGFRSGLEKRKGANSINQVQGHALDLRRGQWRRACWAIGVRGRIEGVYHRNSLGNGRGRLGGRSTAGSALAPHGCGIYAIELDSSSNCYRKRRLCTSEKTHGAIRKADGSATIAARALVVTRPRSELPRAEAQRIQILDLSDKCWLTRMLLSGISGETDSRRRTVSLHVQVLHRRWGKINVQDRAGDPLTDRW